MLKIWLGPFQDNCIKNPGRYFDMNKERDWFNKHEIRKIIKEIDGVDVIQDEFLISPILGGMSPMYLSHGCKTLILLYINPLCNVYASRCGDNCAGFITDLSEKTDVVITLHHPMVFPKDFSGMILDNGKTFNTREGYLDAYLDFKYGGKK